MNRMHALLDAFALASRLGDSLQLNGDAAAEALAEWASVRSDAVEVESGEMRLADGRRWRQVQVRLSNRAWITAHRPFLSDNTSKTSAVRT